MRRNKMEKKKKKRKPYEHAPNKLYLNLYLKNMSASFDCLSTETSLEGVTLLTANYR